MLREFCEMCGTKVGQYGVFQEQDGMWVCKECRCTPIGDDPPIGCEDADKIQNPKNILQVLFKRRGRITRLQYFLAMLLLNVCGASLTVMLMVVFGERASEDQMPLFICAISLLILYPYLMVAIKRIHDLNESAANVVLLFVPIASTLYAWYLVFADGTEGINRYGPQPKTRGA